MISSPFQVPPRPAGASARCRGNPPSMSVRFRAPSAKKPTERLFGDQKGNKAPSVPASERSSPVSSKRSRSCDRPSEIATNTIFSPSGEIASDVGAVVDGVITSRRNSGFAAGDASRAPIIAAAATSRIRSAPAPTPNTTRRRRSDGLEETGSAAAGSKTTGAGGGASTSCSSTASSIGGAGLRIDGSSAADSTGSISSSSHWTGAMNR